MDHTRRTRQRWRPPGRLIGLVAALALVATACGDDDDDGRAPDTTTASTTGGGIVATTAGDTRVTTVVTPSTAASQPVAGGEATVLLFDDIGSADPVTSAGSAGSDGQRMFALYGALVQYVSADHEVAGYFATAFTPNADSTVWTLKLKPGIVFSDGSPYDAAAVKTNWERAKDPDNQSPAAGVAAMFTTLTAVDATTLSITLRSPDAHLPNTISRYGALNFVASPTAIAEAADLVSHPVGAGPFTLEEWVRDDHMTLVKNPDFVDRPLPYLDQLTLRTVADEQRRLDVFTEGDAEAGYTSSPATAAAAQAAGAAFVGVTVGTGHTFVFNNSVPPFDDPRVRRAFVIGLDRDAMTTALFGEGAVAATNFSRPGTPWFDARAIVPGYDPVEAQKLFTEAAADLGGTVTITLQGLQQPLDQRRAEYVQTALNRYDGVDVEFELDDPATWVAKVVRGDYEVSSWDFPFLDPEPGMYGSLRTGLPTNVARYSNQTVDTALDQAHVSRDDTARLKLYQAAWAGAAKDLPFYPYVDTTNGFFVADTLHGAEIWEDGILRFDKLWKEP